MGSEDVERLQVDVHDATLCLVRHQGFKCREYSIIDHGKCAGCRPSYTGYILQNHAFDYLDKHFPSYIARFWPVSFDS